MALLSLFVAPSQAHAQAYRTSVISTITGTVVGANGLPMPLADVTMKDAAYRVVSVAHTDSAGRFALAYDGRPASLFLEFYGVAHQQQSEEIYIDHPQSIGLAVRLATEAYADTIVRVRAIGDFNKFDWATARPLKLSPDQSWTLVVATTADSVAYQLRDLVANEATTGTDTDRYMRRAAGDYASVIPAQDGVATIVFSPTQLHRSQSPSDVRFHDSTGRTARVARVLESMNAHTDALLDEMRHPGAVPGPLRAIRQAKWNPVANALSHAIDSERDPEVRSVQLLELMQLAAFGATVPARYGKRTLREILPASPLWTLPVVNQVGLVAAAVVVAGRPNATRVWFVKEDPALLPRYLALSDAIFDAQRDGTVRVGLLAREVATLNSLGKTDQVSMYLTRLASEYPNAELTKSTLAQYGNSRLLKIGNDVPVFRFASLRDSTVTYTPQSLIGKVYLIDFWATWCAGCIDQIPVLQQAYDVFRSRGFEILSVSADAARTDVMAFQSKRFPMPWLNAITAGGLENADLKRLEILYLPRAVLVDRSGKIIAVDDELKGAALERTLSRVFNSEISR
ncbi:MAG: redoxin family protein [Gemmatimonadota bacterium]|nr:redoxin family protein [Gemmatimonadota bacterium]